MPIQPSTRSFGSLVEVVSANPLRGRLLQVLAEQKAAALDQLSRFLGIPSDQTEGIVEALRGERLVACERLVAGEAQWVWLTAAGAARSGTGFRAHKPSRTGLSHLRQINEVRLLVEAGDPGLEWVSERVLRRRKGRHLKGFVPDAAVRAGEEVHAIEVELSRKSATDLEAKIISAETEYDVVVYFATPEVARFIERIGVVERHPNLVVRELDRPSPDLRRADWREPGDPPPGGGPDRVSFEPSAHDVEVLDLLVEQQAIPMDQLYRYLDQPEEVVEGLIWRYLRAGLVRRARPVPCEAPWVWVTLRGIEASNHESSEPRPRLGGLAMLRAVNEVRLSVHGRRDLRWRSGRLMRRDRGRVGSVPKAVIESAGERHAVDVFLSNPKDASKMEEVIRCREREYDAAVWFYSRRACARVEQFAAVDISTKLVVRPLPCVEVGDLRPDSWRVDVGAVRPEVWGPGGERRSGPRTATDELWARLRKAGPVQMCRVDDEDVPEEALEAVAEICGSEWVRLRGQAWRRVGATSIVFRLETDAGVYRVVRSRWGWRAALVADEGLFELLEGPAHRSRILERRASGTIYEKAEPRSAEVPDDVWQAIQPLIPPIEERRKAHGGGRPLGDRLMVDGVVYLLRSGTPLHRLSPECGFGSERTIRRRLRYWESLGVWDPVCEELARRLPDGEELDWARLRQ